jgi:hypothetical protein
MAAMARGTLNVSDSRNDWLWNVHWAADPPPEVPTIARRVAVSVTGTYDPAINQTLWEAANPVRMFDPFYLPGDNLHTDRVISYDPDTGHMNWYFQSTAGRHVRLRRGRHPYDHRRPKRRAMAELNCWGGKAGDRMWPRK